MARLVDKPDSSKLLLGDGVMSMSINKKKIIIHIMFLLAIPIIPRTKTTTTKVEQYRYWNRLSNTSAVSLDRLLIRHSELPTGGAAM